METDLCHPIGTRQTREHLKPCACPITARFRWAPTLSAPPSHPCPSCTMRLSCSDQTAGVLRQGSPDVAGTRRAEGLDETGANCVAEILASVQEAQIKMPFRPLPSSSRPWPATLGNHPSFLNVLFFFDSPGGHCWSIFAPHSNQLLFLPFIPFQLTFNSIGSRASRTRAKRSHVQQYLRSEFRGAAKNTLTLTLTPPIKRRGRRTRKTHNHHGPEPLRPQSRGHVQGRPLANRPECRHHPGRHLGQRLLLVRHDFLRLHPPQPVERTEGRPQREHMLRVRSLCVIHSVARRPHTSEDVTTTTDRVDFGSIRSWGGGGGSGGGRLGSCRHRVGDSYLAVGRPDDWSDGHGGSVLQQGRGCGAQGRGQAAVAFLFILHGVVAGLLDELDELHRPLSPCHLVSGSCFLR